MIYDVVLFGTCNGSNWRELLMPELKKNNIDFFDPVVADWTKESMRHEEMARNASRYLLYVLTPKMAGVWAVAEIADLSNKVPGRLIFAYLDYDEGEMFTEHQIKSLNKLGNLILSNGAIWLDFDKIVPFLKKSLSKGYNIEKVQSKGQRMAESCCWLKKTKT